ncbi:MAG: hypothetical protein ABR991_07890 [Terracidiphilus sp.]|jgi:hypothetical protein
MIDAQFVEQPGHGPVDEIASVVRVEAQDTEGKLAYHLLHQQLQIALRDVRRDGGDLPLRDSIDGIVVINALCILLVALMHRAKAQKVGLA